MRRPHTQDIFDSDEMFIAIISSFLMVAGLLGLAYGIGCRFLAWNLCNQHLVPIFGGTTIFRSELSDFNLPLSMLILSFGLRLYNEVGWIISCALLLILGGFFTYLAWWLNKHIDLLYYGRLANGVSPMEMPYLESIFTNAALAILCLAGLIYLGTKGVRRLYFGQIV